MQHRKQPAWARLQLLTRLALNAGKHTANQPARLAQLDDGNDRAIVVQGDEGPAQVVRLGHRGTPSVRLQRRRCHVLAARPIESSSTRAPCDGTEPRICRCLPMMVDRHPPCEPPPPCGPAATAPSPTEKSLPLAPAGTASNFTWSGKKTATLYRVTVPADPVLVHGNRLVGAKGPRPVPLQCDAPPCGPPP